MGLRHPRAARGRLIPAPGPPRAIHKSERAGCRPRSTVPDPGGERAKADRDFYEVVTHAPEGPFADVLASVGWTVAVGPVEVAVTRTPAGTGEASGSAADGASVAYALEANALAPSALKGLPRFWHVTPGGTAHVDYSVDAAVLAGEAVCDLKAGSMAASAVGGACGTGDATVGLIVPSTAWKAQRYYFPGIHAA
ncbi:MAG TPA: hypothetical protein VM889_00360 [Candidatus Thermoplasmatota archaeon]|nr:hypothetical protein [Candidatus Thermoplasmatota archaeon]